MTDRHWFPLEWTVSARWLPGQIINGLRYQGVKPLSAHAALQSLTLLRIVFPTSESLCVYFLCHCAYNTSPSSSGSPKSTDTFAAGTNILVHKSSPEAAISQLHFLSHDPSSFSSRALLKCGSLIHGYSILISVPLSHIIHFYHQALLLLLEWIAAIIYC